MSRLFLVAFLGLSACSHTVPSHTTEGWAIVVVQEAFSLRHCERVGPITTEYGGANKERNNTIALRTMRNKAGLTKATHLAGITLLNRGPACGNACIRLTAVMYRCQPDVVSR